MSDISFTIKQGATFDVKFELDVDGVAKVFGSEIVSVRADFRQNQLDTEAFYEIRLPDDSSSFPSGTSYTHTISDTYTSSFPVGTFWLDVEYVMSDGKVYSSDVLKCNVKREMTR